jgi:hypothetical protein
MKCGGFVVGYQYPHDKEMRFDGPHSEIQVAQKHFDDLKSLEPAVQDVRIYQLMYNPSNDRLI